jgi:hypothetical protein
MKLADLRPDDEVRITGTASSPAGRRFVSLVGVVAAVARPTPAEPDWYVKVWPHEEWEVNPDLTEREILDGKVWFPESGVEALELLRRDEE